jgi:alkanesulfonate monooxygenase SsuD/methylene tetrahydromethanopterin reductase-like flavin-dependent oxidoreductase (luciferase family)
VETQLPMFSWVEEHQHRISFGLQTAARPDDPAAGQRVIAAGRLAESLGFDAYFLADHRGQTTDAWLHLAAIAVMTERIRLGSVVLCNGYRHPTLTARLAADLDNLSGGRFILGIGIGWHAGEFAQLGLPFPPVRERQEALEEAIAIIRGLWGAELFTFQGRYYDTTGGRVFPPPVQRPGPPLLIAGAGERVSLRQVARFGDACNFGPSPQIGGVRTPETVHHKLLVLRRHCEEIGRPYEQILRTYFTSWLILGEDEASVRAKVARYYPQGMTEEQRLSRLIGTPATAIAHYQAMADAGIQYFVVQVQDAADEETFRLLAQEVAPKIRPGPVPGEEV